MPFFFSRPKKLLKPPQTHRRTPRRVQMSERRRLFSFIEQSTLHYRYPMIIPLFSIFISSSSSSCWIPREFVHVSLCASEARPSFFCCSAYCSPMEVDKDYRWLDAPLIPGLLRARAEDRCGPCLHIKDRPHIWPAISRVAACHLPRCLACGHRFCQTGIMRLQDAFQEASEAPPNFKDKKTTYTFSETFHPKPYTNSIYALRDVHSEGFS